MKNADSRPSNNPNCKIKRKKRKPKAANNQQKNKRKSPKKISFQRNTPIKHVKRNEIKNKKQKEKHGKSPEISLFFHAECRGKTNKQTKRIENQQNNNKSTHTENHQRSAEKRQTLSHPREEPPFADNPHAFFRGGFEK